MKFPKALAALDFSSIDRVMLLYLKYLIRPLGIQDVCFMHILKIMALPRISKRQLTNILKPDYALDELLKSRLEDEVAQVNLPFNKSQMGCEVHEGRPVHELVNWSENKKIDLVIVGNKRRPEGSGITARRMAHRLKCNMLFVPEKIATPIEEIVVPVDYSENSVRAIWAAIHLSDRIGNVKIRAVHIQEALPVNQYSGNLSDKNFTSLIKERNVAAFEKLIEDHEIDQDKLEFVLLEQSSGSVASTLREYLTIRKCDLIVMGSIGHNAGHNLIYGSTTERLVDDYIDSPILIIR